MSVGTLDRPMAKERTNRAVRIDDEAMSWAKIASGYTDESMSEYISRIVKERAKEDAERLHAEKLGLKPQPRITG